MGAQQPFLYEADRTSAVFPSKAFDPKAVSRASWHPKPVKPPQDGPLVQLNRHPDAHEIIGGNRQPYKTMSSTTKAWIKAMRVVQLLLRVLQFVGATGILVLIILINNVPGLTTWVMRITAGFVIVHTAYSIYHHSKPAGYRTPASSAAYQVFAAFSDLCVIPLYLYGTLAARNSSTNWSTLLTNKDTVPYLITAFYYTLIGSGGVHLVTLTISFWLAIKFHDVARMPPDVNPLGDRYTARSKKRQLKETKKQLQQEKQYQHMRSKSSIATADTFESLTSLDNDKNLLSRPPSVPFMDTRMGGQDARWNLPSRQSQNSPASSARNSMANLKRSAVVTTPTGSARGIYAEIPLHDGGYSNTPSPHHSSRPSSSRPSSSRPSSARPNYAGTPNKSVAPGPGTGSPAGLGMNSGANAGSGRPPWRNEAWSTSESLADRTQQRNHALNTMVLNASGKRRNYEVVSQAYDFHDSDSDGSDAETVHRHPGAVRGGVADENDRYDNYETYHNDEDSDPNHPNPLRSNPLPQRTKTPFRRPGTGLDMNRTLSEAPSMSSSVHTSTTHQGSVLGELPLNDRRVSGGGYTGDIADARRADGFKADSGSSTDTGRGLTGATFSPPQQQKQFKGNTPRQASGKRWSWTGRSRNSSIQPETEFYSKPYGQLKPATPPLVVEEDLARAGTGTRQISSGNDYDLGSDRYLSYGGDNGGMTSTFGRRNVSGKVAEEGRAYARFSTLNDY